MADTEKITINMNVVDLGQVDLLVEQGFYSNRTDFIKTAIRNQLSKHSTELKEIITRETIGFGVVLYGKSDLEKYLKKGSMLEIKVVGMLILARDITPELALSTIKCIKVHGKIKVNEDVKKALGDRIQY